MKQLKYIRKADQCQNKLPNSSGFTIVELLIVIVVIGILAAIVIVAYNGVQDRARASKMITAIDVYEKALRNYVTTNGKLPETPLSAGGGGAYDTVCLGDNYPVSGYFNAGQCLAFMTAPYGYVNTTVNAAFKTQLAQLPDVSDIIVGNNRGISYTAIPNSIARFTYYLKGDQICLRGSKQTTSSSGVVTQTQCTKDFNFSDLN